MSGKLNLDFSGAKRALLEQLLQEEGLGQAGQKAIPTRAGAAPAPLSFAQERLWFVEQLQPGSPAYNMPFAVQIEGALDIAALHGSLQEIVCRHEALRTTFVEEGDRPVQIVASEARLAMPCIDLQAAGDARGEQRRLFGQEALRPFDLGAGPLFRALLMRLSETCHVLVLNLHHTICDGASISILTGEMASLYAACRTGSPSPLAELPLQYADYAVWQRGLLQGEELEGRLGYWREQLGENPPALDLPLDRPRPKARSFRGGRCAFSLGRSRSQALIRLGRQQRATPFMTLLSAFGAFLQRCTGGRDLVLGSPIANRDRSDVQGLIGLFANMLALRLDLRGDPTFLSFLDRVRKTALGAYAHQDLPFERLVEALQPERSLSHTPLFQAVFALAPKAVAEPRCGLRMQPLDNPSGTAKFDLSLLLSEGQDGVAGSLEFSLDLFDATTAARWVKQLLVLLDGILERPSTPIAQLPLLAPQALQQLLVEWNDTSSAYPAQMAIHRLFEQAAAQNPQTVALAEEESQLSYGELTARSSQIARWLRNTGLAAESPVGLLVGSPLQTLTAILSVLKAGGAYVPLDPGHPSRRLAALADLAGLKHALSCTRKPLPGVLDKSVLYPFGRDSQAVAACSRHGLDAPAGAESLAYVLFTSGSTGTPKAVGVPHRAVVRLVRQANYAQFDRGQIFLQLAPLSFDASTFEIWGSLLNGARLALSPQAKPSLEGIGRLLARHRITTLWLTAGLFHQMAEHNLPGLQPVRQLLAGGDTLSVEHVRRILDELEGCRLINGYGPTEATTFSCCATVGWEDALRPSIPIGRPISNSRAYILDRSMQPVPPGVFGELFIGGDGLARGYLGRPQDTAWCWVPAPWGEAQGARLYRSGDRVRHLTDGRIEFLGRADSQVKLRGYRVEPGEVEAVLSRHPSVGQCAVAVQPAPDDQRRLAAYFTAASSSPARPVSPADLKDYLAQRLPDFMIPAVILQLAELPLGPTGKVDYRALSSPSAIQQAEEAPSQRRHQPPRSPLEEALAEIWQDLLDVSGLDVQDNFFEKGGHSLLATAVVSRVRKVFGVEVPLTALFEVPTIAGLGRAVESAGRQGQAPSAPPLLPRESSQVHTPAPLSFAQQRLWFLHQLQPADAAYNISSALRLRGALKIDLAEQVFSEIERRHEALRTTFEEGSQGLVQIVHPASRVRIPRIDLRRLDDRRRTVEARQLSILLARRPFDLANGPLYRLSLLQTGRNAHLLLLDMHHIVSDGWSMGIFVQETASLYQAFRDGKDPLLSPLPIQYPDFAVWQRNWLQGQALDELLQHWQRQLGRDLAALDLPSDRPRPAEQSQRGARLDFQLGPRLKNRISAFSRSHSSTLFITLLTAFQTLLARLCSQQQVTVGSPIAGRSRPEVEGLIGLFVNTLVLRTRIDPNLSFEELLRRVRSVALQGYQHQDLPFERLVEALQPRRSLSRSPLFQVMFILQNMPAPRIDLPGLTLQAGEIDTGSAKFDLTLSLSDREGVLKCILEYATDLFDATTMHRFAAQFERLLRGALDRPGAPVRDLPLMGPSQLHQLLYEWQGGDAPADGRCLHQLFADQARRTPDAVALLAGPEQLSCSWIARRAAGLAGRLRAFGVGPEARVGVCLERRSDLPAALLAVLEAGGAYVPIDPAYPAERTRFMLEDSQQGNAAAVLVTQQKLRSRFRDYGGQTVCIDPFKPQDGSGQAPLDQAAAASRGNLAYLIYTSGSTGRPKGVAIEHRSAVALVRWAAEAFALEHLQGVLASTSVCFDLSIFEIFVPLSLGGRIILAESALDLAEMPRAPLGDITLINSVPSILTELLRTGPLPATVRTVNLAGESLRRGLVRQICRSSSVQAVFNLYGPSEDTTYSTWARIEAGTPGEPPIGRPLAGTQAYVLDQRLNPVPVGASGQLFLAGQGLARGYHGRFSLTGEGFLPNPFTSSPGQRMYRTGDRARLRNDGQIDFLGRSDHQVKLRGFRIELQEIEAVLLADAQLEGAAALVCQAPSGDGQLIAYVEPLGIDQQALAQRLRQALPAYMVPTLIEALPALPRTPNGKVDRAALEARPPGKALHKRRATPPQTEQERLLAAAWADVLGSRSPGREDDFFESGGHSLLAVRLAARLRESGLELPLRAVFEAPALAAMAQKISPGGRKAPSASAIAPAAQAELPLSFAQERLWLLQQIEPGSPAFNLPLALELEGKLQAGALIQAVTEIVRRHAALRTLFPSRQGQPAQVVQEVANTALVCLADLSGLPPSRRDPQARRIVRDQALAPFELARQPGLRSLLVRIRERRHAFAATLHHIVADGWSLGIFKRELALLYSRLAANGGSSPEALPELPVQFADFAAWERRTLPSEGLEESLQACAERLRGVPTRLDLPSDRPRPPLQSFRCALKTRRLGPRLAAEAEQIGRRQGATLFMTLLAVFEVILARWTGLSRFLIGTPVAQRSRSELEGMIGLLVNTVVVRAEVAAEASFAKLLRQVRESALQALNKSSLPFAQLVEKMQPERSTNHSPVVQVMFNLLHFPESSAPAPPGLSVRDIPLGEPATDLDLILTAQPLQAASPKGQGDLELSLVYNTDLFDPQRASALLVQIEQMLRQAARDPDKPVGRFSLAAEACLELPDPTAALEAASKEAVPARLSRFAQQAPHRTAIQAPGCSWSYGRLEASARRLAQRLAECGVGRGDLVVVQAGRDAALIEALTAVLRSGAAFLILDPSDPPARLMETLEDAQPRAWLTTRTWPPQQSKWADWTAQSGLRRLELPAELAGPDSQAGGEAQSPADPAAADIAYVALTSGSTGKPKGILGTHGPLSHFLDWYARRFELSPNDRFSMLSGLAHDPLLRDLFAPLWAGAAIAVPAASDYGPSSLPGALTAWMRGQAITVTHLTPATARLLDPEAGPLAALRLAVFAGDVLQPGDVARMRSLAPATTCVNGYGATETPQLAACHVLPPDEALPPCGDGQLSLPIGRGIEAAQLWVVPLGEAEPDGRLAGVGELGEIVVRSLHLSQGYLNDDRLTRRRFLANPLRQSPDDRLYRTGDLGRYLPDGSVRVHGRIDRQIKIRGLRVEPAEIERCCLSHPEIVDAAVEPRPAANGDQRLVAYLAARPGRAPAIGGLVRRPLPNGLAVAELNRGETDYLYREIFDLQAYLRHGIELRDGDCIFDVGANIGLFMLFAHQLCRSPRLYCFEPNPEAFEVLSANARLCSPQPQLFNYGISDADKTVPFTFFTGMSILSGVYADRDSEKQLIKSFFEKRRQAGEKEAEEILLHADDLLEERLQRRQLQCRLRPLSDVMAEAAVQRIDLLKINVEKSELDAVAGVHSQDWAKIRQVVLEVDLEEHLEPVCEVLQRQGYETAALQDELLSGSGLRYVYAARPDQCPSWRPSGRPGAQGRHLPAADAPPLLSSEELGRHLRKRLPGYMVPSAFVFLDELPRTARGKIDRAALPDPSPEAADTGFQAPQTATQVALAAIWQELLGVPSVGSNDDFFTRGGHSLLATRLLARLSKAFGVELPLRQLFETPRLAQLAAAIDARRPEGEAPLPLMGIGPAPEQRHEPFPLTPIQQAYWVGRSGAFELGNVSTHLYLELESPDVDLERFEKAWQRLVDRHDMLRAVVGDDGQQRILSDLPPYRIEVEDLSSCSARQAEERWVEVRRRMSHQVLPADRWPLFELRACRLPAGRTRLHVSFDFLIADAWSIRILLAELGAAYAQPSIALQPLSLSFRDYVLAEKRLEGSQQHQRSLAYWRSRAGQLPPGPELPLAGNPAGLDKPRFVRRAKALPAPVWQRLQKRAAQAGLTPSGVLLAAFAETLSSWSKSPHFTLVLTLFNRLPLHPQVDCLVGDFTSLSLLERRPPESRQESFQSCARRLQQQLWDDLDHRFVSGVEVLRERTRQSGSLGGAAAPVVFTSTLGLGGSSAAPTDPSAAQLPGEMVYSITQTPQILLDHQVMEQGGKLIFNWDAVDDLFPPRMLDDAFAAYCCLLDRLASQEQAWAEAAPLPLPPALSQLIEAANATQAPLPEELRLQELFFSQARRQPDAAAVLCQGRCLSYSELALQAKAVGRELRSREALPNTLVAVVMNKGWEQVAAVLGVLASGAAYLPIDPSMPAQRLHMLLEHSHVRVALTQPPIDRTLDWPQHVERIILEDGSLQGKDVEEMPPVQQPDDLAYVIFTSGSTGMPKGVMIDHRGAANTILDLNQRFDIGCTDRVLALSALTFDLSVYDIFGLLATGGAVVLPEPSAARDPQRWTELLTEHGVTVWNSVPTLAAMWADSLPSPGAAFQGQLRLMMLSGDWIPVDLPDRLRGLAEGLEVISLGGATEASIWSILFPIGPVDPAWQSIPYGKPLRNQTFHVLDEELRPKPVWATGQLYIGGLGVAQGYWGDQQRSRQSFVVHPESAERLYRTGDLGRWLPDGNIEFLGREDFQVKVQGYRIELGEVEAALARQPQVRKAVVTAIGERMGSKALVAYVVPQGRRNQEAHIEPPEEEASLPLALEGASPQLMLHPGRQLEFKLSQPGLRRDEGRPRIALSRPSLDEAFLKRHTARRSERRFLPRPVPLDSLARLLSCLMQVAVEGQPLPKHRYPSAGSLYPVQAYLDVMPGRIDGLAGGTYYYHPQRHRLERLWEEPATDPAAHAEVNRPIFAQSAFTLLLVADLDAIRPLYGDAARNFCLLEAGYMGQLLMEEAAGSDIGLCPVGGVDFERLRPRFQVGSNHLFLHALLGGPIERAGIPSHRAQAPSQGSPAERPAARSGSDHAQLASTLRQALARSLPEYMLPAHFVVLEDLPLTANGKVDRRSLPLPGGLEDKRASGYVAPRDEMEQAIAAAWQKVLGRKSVGVEDNFFDLGGTSVEIVRLHAELQQATGRAVSLVALFNYPTVNAMARYLSRQGGKQGEDDPLAESRRRARVRRARRGRQPGGP